MNRGTGAGFILAFSSEGVSRQNKKSMSGWLHIIIGENARFSVTVFQLKVGNCQSTEHGHR